MWDCLKSLFTLHNETVNIWTHLIGGMLWLREGYLFSLVVPESDRAVVGLVAVLGLIMFVASAGAHAFACVSPFTYKYLWKADYAGILLLWYARILFDSYFLL